MSLIVTLLLGGLAGWIASLILNRNENMGILLNIVVGILGAFLANIVIAPAVGIRAQLDTVSFEGFLMSVVGAILLLSLVNLVTRRSVR
jgi:uncharacterized membrane protein YeaQ/YmgE (transglycosylase-associated protein family)